MRKTELIEEQIENSVMGYGEEKENGFRWEKRVNDGEKFAGKANTAVVLG